MGSNEVIAVSAIRSVTGPQIKSFAIEPINPEASQEPAVGKEAHRIKKLSAEARAILLALEKIKEPGAFVNVAVSPIHVVTRHFIMPAVPKREEAGAVCNEASRYIPFKISESVLDYHTCPAHKNIMSVTATAIRSEVLETCLQDLRSASAKVLMVEPVYSAVGRAFSSLNITQKTSAHGFVVLQSDGNVNVTLAAKGVVYLSRDFLLTGKMEEDKGRFCEELKASMDYFYKLTGGDAIGQIFLAGTGDLKVWVEHLEHAFNYALRFDVANLPNAGNISPEILSTILVPFGLALRSLGYRSPFGEIKLLPGEERRTGLQQFLTFLGIECVVILALFAMVRLIGFQPYLMSLKAQEEAILRPVIQADPGFAFKTLDELTMEKENVRARVGQLERFFDDRIAPPDFLTAFGQGMPQSISLNDILFSEEIMPDETQTGKRKKRLKVQGNCFLGNAEKEAGIIAAWVKALPGKKDLADYFSEIKLEEIKRGKIQGRNLTSFSIVGE